MPGARIDIGNKPAAATFNPDRKPKGAQMTKRENNAPPQDLPMPGTTVSPDEIGDVLMNEGYSTDRRKSWLKEVLAVPTEEVGMTQTVGLLDAELAMRLTAIGRAKHGDGAARIGHRAIIAAPADARWTRAMLHRLLVASAFEMTDEQRARSGLSVQSKQ